MHEKTIRIGLKSVWFRINRAGMENIMPADALLTLLATV
jgi:hypothetical protein